MRRVLIGLVLMMGCSTPTVLDPVESYLEGHPHTLLDNAEAMRRGELIVGMTDQEVQVLMGEPMSVAVQTVRGQRRLAAAYRESCQFVRRGEVRDIKGPVTLSYFEHESGEWRLVSAMSIWRR